MLGRMITYAVIWRENSGPVCVGQLRFLGRTLRLEGRTRGGAEAALELRPGDVLAAGIGRDGRDRLDGRRAVAVERVSGGRVLIASAGGVGELHEIADRLGAATNNGSGL